uniref:Uncharacterized protein n=1 Tax=Sarcoptes scabiei TaxID=52283 RepID=A0A834RGB7_SARSC
MDHHHHQHHHHPQDQHRQLSTSKPRLLIDQSINVNTIENSKQQSKDKISPLTTSTSPSSSTSSSSKTSSSSFCLIF